MLQIIFALLSYGTAQAIVMEPAFEAAESLGYQVVGEIEFGKNSVNIPDTSIKKQITEIGEMCPRTQSFDPNISSFVRFVILAWSDMDYPKRTNPFHSAHQQWLAHKRGLAVAEKIRTEIKGNINFELVNMAHRKPHLLNGRSDVKNALETAGAAPSDRLGMGLFAEYSQAAKAVILVDCKESLQRRKNTMPSLVQLASLGRVVPGP